MATSKILAIESILKRYLNKEITLFISTSEIISIFAKIRNSDQNAKYWVQLSILEQHTGHSKEELHDIFKYKFLSFDKMFFDSNYKILKSTTKLSKFEFCEYLNKIQIFASEFFNINLE